MTKALSFPEHHFHIPLDSLFFYDSGNFQRFFNSGTISSFSFPQPSFPGQCFCSLQKNADGHQDVGKYYDHECYVYELLASAVSSVGGLAQPKRTTQEINSTKNPLQYMVTDI